MSTPKRSYRAECDPEQVMAALDALVREALDESRSRLDTWAALAEHNRWHADWQTRKARQWSLLSEWALATGIPEVVRRAIFLAEHHCITEALRAEARANQCERKANGRQAVA